MCETGNESQEKTRKTLKHVNVMNGLIMRSKKKSKDTLKQMKMRTPQSKIYGTQGKHSEKEIHSIRGLPQVTITPKKSQIDNLTLHFKEMEEEQRTKSKVGRR